MLRNKWRSSRVRADGPLAHKGQRVTQTLRPSPVSLGRSELQRPQQRRDHWLCDVASNGDRAHPAERRQCPVERSKVESRKAQAPTSILNPAFQAFPPPSCRRPPKRRAWPCASRKQSATPQPSPQTPRHSSPTPLSPQCIGSARTRGASQAWASAAIPSKPAPWPDSLRAHIVGAPAPPAIR